MILGVTGHRELGGYNYPNPIYNYVYKKIVSVLKEHNPKCVITGGAVGTDQLAAVICIRLNIPFVVAVPFLGQEKMWPEKTQKQYNKILDHAADVLFVSEEGYESWKMQKRNKFIVDNCDNLLGIFNGNYKSGTGKCIKYAENVGREIIIINPDDA